MNFEGNRNDGLQTPEGSGQKRLNLRRAAGWFCVAAATGLLSLDVIGTLIPLRNPDIYHEPRNQFSNDITLTAEEFWKRVPRRTQESTSEYARRMTETVADAIAHLQVDDRQMWKKYRWEIPIWENYLIWASRQVLQFRRWTSGTLDEQGSAYAYSFADYHRALERGVGLCTTHCVVLMGVLKENHIRIQLVGIGRHSVTRAEVAPGTWWILDPDFGVVLPYDLADVRKNPRLIEPYYEAHGHSQKWIALLEEFYADPNPVIFNDVKDAYGHTRYYFGAYSYFFIWVIPATLALMGFAFLRLPGRKVKRSVQVEKEADPRATNTPA